MIRNINIICNAVICKLPSILRAQPKRINVGDGIAVGIGVAVEGDGIGDIAFDDVGIDKSAQIWAVVAGAHVDKPVLVGHDAISAVVAEEDNAATRSRRQSAVGVVGKGIGDVAARLVTLDSVS